MSVLVAQVTDTHLLSSFRLRGFPTWDSLSAVLDAVRLKAPDYLLLTGDLAEAGEQSAYAQLLELVNPLNIPTFWLPGNHDQVEHMNEMLDHLPFDARKSVEMGGWRVILLDSVMPSSQIGTGAISAETLAWLQMELHTFSDQPTLIALHHHPVPTGVDWLDQIGLSAPENFYEAIARFPQVHVVIFGHIHQDFHQRRGTVDYYGCPSTCTQVATTAQNNSTMLPGFRLLYLHENGEYQTHIERVPFVAQDQNGSPDFVNDIKLT